MNTNQGADMTTNQIAPGRTQRPLTDDELQQCVDAARRSWVDAVRTVLRIMLNVDVTSPHCPKFSPSLAVIPATQWGIIASACTVLDDDAISSVNAMLDWMNYGPSSYDPDSDPS
jgi:hypothetical protein